MKFKSVYNTTEKYFRIKKNRNRILLKTKSNRNLWRSKLLQEKDFKILDDQYGGKRLIYCGARKILKDRPILEYLGYVLNEDEYKKYYNDTNLLPTYVVEIKYKAKKYYIDAGLFGNISRFINHSCRNYNTVLKTMTEKNEKVIAIYCTQSINPGDEILLSYGCGYFSNKDRTCKCYSCI